MNHRRKNQELNHLLKDGQVPIHKRAGEGLWNQGAELVALGARWGDEVGVGGKLGGAGDVFLQDRK